MSYFEYFAAGQWPAIMRCPNRTVPSKLLLVICNLGLVLRWSIRNLTPPQLPLIPCSEFGSERLVRLSALWLVQEMELVLVNWLEYRTVLLLVRVLELMFFRVSVRWWAILMDDWSATSTVYPLVPYLVL